MEFCLEIFEVALEWIYIAIVCGVLCSHFDWWSYVESLKKKEERLKLGNKKEIFNMISQCFGTYIWFIRVAWDRKEDWGWEKWNLDEVLLGRSSGRERSRLNKITIVRTRSRQNEKLGFSRPRLNKLYLVQMKCSGTE